MNKPKEGTKCQYWELTLDRFNKGLPLTAGLCLTALALDGCDVKEPGGQARQAAVGANAARKRGQGPAQVVGRAQQPPGCDPDP